jgi:outer membrane protein assembly complex protein YaeT
MATYLVAAFLALVGQAAMDGFALVREAAAQELVGDEPLENEDELTVSRVYFEGNDALDADQILERLWITPRPWSVWNEPTQFERDQLRDDLRRIESIYKAAGYYEARVTNVDIAVRPDGRSVDITFTIDEGQPVRVTTRARIIYPGASADEIAEIENLNPLEVGEVFSVAAFENARLIIRTKLRNRGYYAAEVTPESWVRPRDYAADATFTIAAGPRVHFGTTRLEGNESVTQNIVWREIEWEEGEWYNESAVESTIQDLYGTNLFRVVRIQPEYPGDATDPMPMVIRVTEAPFQSLRFGFGYGTEDRFRIQSRYNHYNFLGGARRLDVLLRYSALLRNAETTLIQPVLFSKRTSVGITAAYREEERLGAFSFNRWTLSPRINRRIGRNWLAYTGYQLEHNESYNIRSGIPLSERSSAEPGFLSGLFFGLERSGVDSLLFPRRGNISRATWLQAGKFFGGDFDFYKWTFESRQYINPLRRTVFELRGRLGVGEGYPGSRVPLYEKFYSGGTNSVRGYRLDRLGPSIGGLTLVETSLEGRRRVYGDFWLAGFADMGMVSLLPYDWQQNQVRWGVGGGVRVTTIVGLARADIGIPLQPRFGEPTWRFHLSIGQAF